MGNARRGKETKPSKRGAEAPAPTPASDPPSSETEFSLPFRAAIGLAIYLVFVWFNDGFSSGSGRGFLTSEAVSHILATHTILHIGGPHRGGTTLLADLLEAHPRVQGFNEPAGGFHSRAKESAGTKGPMNEGVFIQSVFPQYRLMMNPLEVVYRTITGTLRQNGTGWGSYSYAPDAHLTEANETGLLTVYNRRKLMTQWASHWPQLDLLEINATAAMKRPPRRRAGKVLLEKSPTNIMMWRFIDALWRLQPSFDDVESDDDEAPAQQADTGASGALDVRFVFISRHPLAVSLSQKSWNDASHLSVAQLVEHWLHQQESLRRDLEERPGAHVKQVKLEQLSRDAAGTVAELLEWLGLEKESTALEAAEDVLERVPVRGGTNEKYEARFCDMLRRSKCKGYHRMLLDMEERVLRAGYSLQDWGNSCDVPCTSLEAEDAFIYK